jgi:dTDP-4-amino-4,6-dideoxygalactose transaminase
MSEYHAAVGLAQATRWTSIKQKRRMLLDLYRRHLEPLAYAISLHPSIDQAVVSLLMLRFDQPTGPDLIAGGKAEGVGLHRTYLPPLYRHPHFAGIAAANSDGDILPGEASPEKKAAHMGNSEMMDRHIVGVPFHPFLNEAVVAAFQRLADI